MRIYRHTRLEKFSTRALAIGNFDGLHLGHQALLAKTVEVAKINQQVPAVMTFEPHPREFFMPHNAPARLSSIREKLEYFEEAGIEDVFVLRFNHAFAAITADDFMQDVLEASLNAKTILVGGDFCFGAKRKGTLQDLIHAGFKLVDFSEVKVGNHRVSSTLVRDALAKGDFQQAERFLGRHYSISGKVVHGAKRGRQLGYPTANVHMRHERPAFTGVYAVKLDEREGVANLGVRPTIAGIPKLMLEVYVFDFDGDLYDQHVHVQFFHKIRDEMKFAGFDALKVQIALDVNAAQTFFKNHKLKLD
ncbi:MAG TPA: bifunctional riboflavin kinase/FAD synthetase [Methylophilaceae bacterium]|nr:bifunctional riboflavin kinase/FAD synthetase [Methylophilaceae bacterium]